MTTVKNIVAVTWEYEKNWEKKKQYTTIWKLLIKEDGNVSIKIDTVPLERNWRANVYDIKQKSDQNREEKTPLDTAEDLPF